MEWQVVVPVKHRARAKSRLQPYGAQAREAFALAMAGDVVAAALACPGVAEVLVVTDDPAVADELVRLGARAELGAPDGLNPALVYGALLLQQGAPSRGTAALCADLPSLRPHDLAAALAAVPPGGRAVVRDTDGTGTTLLAAAPGVLLAPAYGPGSLQRHLAGGAVELAAHPRLRCDVDTPQDLDRALALGVGPRTAAAAEEVA